MSDQLEKFFSEEEIFKISEFINSELKTKNRIKSPEVYLHFQFIKTKMNQISFCSLLSGSIKLDKFPGIEIKRGRYGGIRLKKPSKTIKAQQPIVKARLEPALPPKVAVAMQEIQNPKEVDKIEKVEQILPPPLDTVNENGKSADVTRVIKQVKQSSWKTVKKNNLFIDNQEYVSTLSNMQFKTIIERVLELPQSTENVRIKFGEKTYTCSDEQAKLLDKLIFYCFGAQIVINGKTNDQESNKQVNDKDSQPSLCIESKDEGETVAKEVSREESQQAT